jgi:hypothetical protein
MFDVISARSNGVHAQIEQGRRPHADERFAPDLDRAFDPLLAEHDLPIVHAHRHELAVVVEVEEIPARQLFLLSGQVRELVVAVEVNFVGGGPDLPAAE